MEIFCVFQRTSGGNNDSESIEDASRNDQQFGFDGQILLLRLSEADLRHGADFSLHNVGWKILLIEVSFQ